MRTLRVRAGLSQRELAARAATSRYYVSAVENGRRDIGFELLHRLLGGLGATLADLERAIADSERHTRRS